MDCQYLKKLNGNEIIERIRRNDEKLFGDLYLCSEKELKGWIQKYSKINRDEALELYHVVFAIFIENIQNGKLKELNAVPSTYLISIARNKILGGRRKKKKIILTESLEDEKRDKEELLISENNESLEENLQKLEAAYLKLSEKCKDLVGWKYFNDLSFREISLELNFKSEAVARNEKHKCMKKLRDLMNL